MSEMPETGSSSIPPWTLGWRMQRSLAHAGITVETMAAELGVSRSTVSRWLNDRDTPPRAGFIKLWALRTGVPLEWLAGERPVPSARGVRILNTCRGDQALAA